MCIRDSTHTHTLYLQSSPGLGQTVQLQHPPLLDQTQTTSTSSQSSTTGAPTLDTEVLYSSVSGAGGGGGIQFSTALEQLGAAGNQTILSIRPEQHNVTTSVGVNFTDGGQQTLHHVDPSSMAFHQPHELLQQPGSHSATVVIQQPIMDDAATSNQSGATVTSLLESQGQYHQLQHIQLEQPQQQQQQQQQLVTPDSQASLQHQMVHHVLVDPTGVDHAGGGHYQLPPGGGDSSGGVASSVVQSDPSQSHPYSTVAASMSAGGVAVEFGDTGSLSLHDSLSSTATTYSS